MASDASALNRLAQYLDHGRRTARDDGLPLLRQWFEIGALMLLGGNGPGYYYFAGMEEKSIPWSHKTAHLGARAYRKAVRRLNHPAYFKLSQHKLAEKAILVTMGIPTPRFLGYFHPSAGRTAEHRPLMSMDDWRNFIDTLDVDRFCVKLAEGFGGAGFRAYSVASKEGPRSLVPFGDTTTITSAALYDELRAITTTSGNGLIVEAYLEQHPVLARLSRSSVNTVRLWVVADDNTARFPLAYLRMGRGTSLVDNQSRGGLVAPIDPSTGIVSAAFDGTPRRLQFADHPDTHAPVEGQQLPFWPEVLEIAERTVRTFPGIRFAGLDIAFGPTSPMVLELNVEPDRLAGAITGVPTGRAIGI